MMEGENRRISNHRKLTLYANWVILSCPAIARGAASGRLDSLAVVVTAWKTTAFTNTAPTSNGIT